ncbi:MAG: hypothetical protein ACP5IT_10060 [Thermoproteota archaeon]
MVKIENIEVLPPDKWLEPCLIIKCEVSIPPNECVTEIKGLLLTEDDKIIGKLEEIPDFSQGAKEIDNLFASENFQYQEMLKSKFKKSSIFCFSVPLTQRAIDCIEKVREKRPKHDVELKVRFLLKYLVSNIATSHLHEISLQNLPSSLKDEFAKIPELKKEGEIHSYSLIVYKYDSNFSPSRTNMWVLSSDSGPKFLSFHKSEEEHLHTIHYDEWVYDFLPKLKAYTVMTIEVPTFEQTSACEHLTKATEELKYAENFLREGNYFQVISSIRNIILNNLTVIKEVEGRKERFLNDEIKSTVVLNAPEEARMEYETVVSGIEKILRGMLDHLSKFIHLDTGKQIRMPLKADAEYLFLATASIVKYLSKMSLPSSR